MRIDLRHGDCVEVMKTLADASVDAVVTDPPYELGFMGKGWDASGIAYSVEMWREVLRVLKPGGHLLAFGGTRTYHRMAVAIEDAGFEIRDSIHWIYGSGFPKSLDVSKAIDKAAGVQRDDKFEGSFDRRCGPTGNKKCEECGKWLVSGSPCKCPRPQDAPQTDDAKQWQGWGTALKPAHEPVVVARKPLIGTVAENVLAYGTGALNIDGCRLPYASAADMDAARVPQPNLATARKERTGFDAVERNGDVFDPSNGRWPPNILLSHTPECGEACAEDCAVAEMDRQSGTLKSGNRKAGEYATQGYMGAKINLMPEIHGDSGGASRFFPVFRYQAKASRSEREHGLASFPSRTGAEAVERKEGSAGLNNPRAGAGRTAETVRNHHPTVKPVELMRWLVRLVTPPAGVVLEPFMGSGTTGVACVQEGFGFVGIEREAEYFEICKARIAAAQAESPAQKELF